jgi:putative ABC transport system permease protein
MNIIDTLRMALSAIFRNKIRSTLTALGVIIGVASVILMVHLGQAATASVTQQISSIGSNLLIVVPGTRERGPSGAETPAPPFDPGTYEAVQSDLFGTRIAPMVNSQQVLVRGTSRHSTGVSGTTNDYMEVRNHPLERGRRFNSRELASGASVCILGSLVVDELFPESDPIGSTIRVGPTACQIIGVLSQKGGSMGQDPNDTVLMPIRAVQRRLVGSYDVQQMHLSAVDTTPAALKASLEALLRDERNLQPGQSNDFRIFDMQEILTTVQGTTRTLTILLGAIAAVSLLVGGIGIMNIMLVSVTERTREIGIRLAIGARARDVLWQFLTEAIVLSSLGGLIGVGLGLAGTVSIARRFGLPLVFSPETILMGFGFSVVIGVVFGYLPARRAAHLNPIDALRHE